MRCDNDVWGAAVDTGAMTLHLAHQPVAEEIVIDVRQSAYPTSHPLILRMFDRIGQGQSLCVINSHDPRPLRYLFDVKYPGAFTWDYLEQGPDVWRVRIGRT